MGTPGTAMSGMKIMARKGKGRRRRRIRGGGEGREGGDEMKKDKD